ncbi:MAG TPA: hypothetical protein VFE16_05500 [Candidatus Cybelea sp.]|jgi:hypothetical protein|nr:hypothetical protein [Candidatus Cybelea sp.]
MRFALLPPEYAALLSNSPEVRLPDVLGFLIATQRWKNGDLSEWIAAFEDGRQRERPSGGRPRDFGSERGIKAQARLPLSLERDLEIHNGLKQFTPVCLMGFDLLEEAVAYLCREPGAANPILTSNKSEIISLRRLFGRDDIDSLTVDQMRAFVRR